MVLDIACGSMAYKTRRNPIVVFCDGTHKNDLDDIDEAYSIFNVKTL